MPSPTTTFGDLRNAKAGQARRRRIPSVAPPPELQDWLRTFQVGTDPGQRVCLRGHWGAVGLKGGCEGAKACLMSLSSDTSYRQAFWVLQWFQQVFTLISSSTELVHFLFPLGSLPFFQGDVALPTIMQHHCPIIHD